MSDSDLYKSPLRKLVKFFEKSRDNWKQKSLEHKKENRRLSKKLRVLETAKKRWKDEAITLRKRHLSYSTKSSEQLRGKNKRKGVRIPPVFLTILQQI